MNATVNESWMLWRKVRWEMRWLILGWPLALIVLYFIINVSDYNAAEWADHLQRNKGLSESARLALNSYQGIIWFIWFDKLMPVAFGLYANAIGAACHMFTCPYIPAQSAINHFTLSLPITRRRALLSHSTFTFGLMALTALIPSLLIPPMARFHGQWFSWKDAVLYSLLMVGGGAIFFGIGYLLAVLFGNWIYAFIVGEILFFVLTLRSIFADSHYWWNSIAAMTGNSYFYQREIPWLALAFNLTLSALLVFTAVRIYERRDL